MFRLIFRAFLIFYFLMPLIALGLIALTFVQVRGDLLPIYESASTTIASASSAIEEELQGLGRNFEPLVNAVNTIRDALQTVVTFVRNTIFTLIDVVNGLNPICNFGGIACIGKSFDVTLPQLIDFSFIDKLSASFGEISSSLDTLVNRTTEALSTYTTLLVLAGVVFAAWVLLSYLLFFALLYTGLWRKV